MADHLPAGLEALDIDDDDDDDYTSNGEDEEMQEQGQIPESRRIQDLDTYIQQYGLRDSPQYGFQSENNLAEAQRRLQEQAQYAETIYERFFSDDGLDERGHKRRSDLIETIGHNEIILFRSQTGGVKGKLKPVAASCETIFSMVANRPLFARDENALEKQGTDRASSSMRQSVEFSLDTFPRESIQEFLHVVEDDKNVNEIRAEYIVDCCQIAHYLQCPTVLEPIVDILLESVDTANCMSLCELADRLNLPRLFERSMSHMMASLSSLKEDDVWADLSSELKGRIEMIQMAIQTSIRSGCVGTNQLYFGSLQEYLAIFAEQVQYHKERLQEAKERQASVEPPYPESWWDARRKIANQEQRVQTLVAIMKEQKKIFSARDVTVRIDDVDPRRPARGV